MKYEIVVIRVIATMLVVLGHSWLYENFSGFTEFDIPGGITGSWLYEFNKFIYTFHMSLFFGISGYLMALTFSKNDINYKRFVSKKTFRIILPYLIISIFYCLPIKFCTGYLDCNKIVEESILHLIYANDSHTWFLLALYWCIIFCIPIGFIERNKPIFLAHAVALISLIHYIGIPNPIKGIDILCLSKGIQYLIYFVFGYTIGCKTWKCYTEKILKNTPPHYSDFSIYMR